MRARIRIADYEMEFEGPAGLWNECLRPIFGGPEAVEPAGAERARGNGTNGSNGTNRGRAPDPEPGPAPRRRDDDGRDAWTRLADEGGRRAEKDAVLLAVWEIGRGERDVAFADVARVVHAHDAFRDVRVKPHLLKHVTRSKMLEAGGGRERVLLTAKGRKYVRSLIG